MLQENLMPLMDDAHLIASAEAELDPLTSTPLERELLRRLEDMQPLAEFVDLFEEHGAEASEIKALVESHPGSLQEQANLLALLNDEDIHNPDQLRELIARAKTFRAIAEDAGDVIDRLSALITEIQE